MEDSVHKLGPFAGMTDRQIHATLLKIRTWTAEGCSPEGAMQRLLADGLSPTQSAAAVRVFLWNTTLVREGPFAGLTERQRDDAIQEAGFLIRDGLKAEKVVRELVAKGLSREHAEAAVAAYRSNVVAEQYRGAPKLMLTGMAVALIGVLATAASAAVATSYYKVFVGAIVGGLAMVLVGIYRRLN